MNECGDESKDNDRHMINLISYSLPNHSNQRNQINELDRPRCYKYFLVIHKQRNKETRNNIFLDSTNSTFFPCSIM